MFINKIPVFTLLLAFLAQPAAMAAPTSSDVFNFIRSRAGKVAAAKYTDPITVAAGKYSLPALIVAKLINRESSFNPLARNGYCFGLMQVARFHFHRGESPFDVAANLNAGCRELASCYRRYPAWPQALTAYNYGPNHRVTRIIGTSSYARQVLAGK